MKTSIKNVKIEDYFNALNESVNVVSEKHPKTKLAHWCTRFVELNKDVTKKLQKEVNKKNKPLLRELEDFRIEKALDKDGLICRTEPKEGEKEGDLIFDKQATKEVIVKKREVEDKLEEISEEFMSGEVECRVFETPIDLPDNISHETLKFLKNFVIANTTEFEEELEEKEVAE